MSKKRKLLFWIIVALQFIHLSGMIAYKKSILIFGKTILLKTIPVDPRDLFRGEYARLRYPISEIDITNFRCNEVFNRGNKIFVELIKGEKYFEPFAVYKKLERSNPENVVLSGRVLRTWISQSIKLGEFADMTDEGWVSKSSDVVKTIENISGYSYNINTGDTIYMPFIQQGGTWQPQIYAINKSSSNAIQSSQYWRNKWVLISAKVISEEKHKFVSVEYGIESYFTPEGKAIKIERSREVEIEIAVNNNGSSVIKRIFIEGKEF